MATTVFDLQAVLGLDSSKYESGLKTAETMATKFGHGLATAAKVGVAAVTAATGAAVAFSKSAIDASISYESAFTGVMKTVEETGKTSYAMLSENIKQMATETASSQEAIAGVMEAAGQLGIVADDITDFTKVMVMLGDTTNLSADEAAIALAHFTNITGESNDNIDRLGAAIVDLGNNFATDEASIVSMSTRLASAGTLAGLTSTDILALSTAMSSVGIQAEMGGTAMTQILTKMSNAVMDGGAKLDLFAKTAGMTSEEFAAKWKGAPTNALSDFVKGLSSAADAGENTNHILEDLGIKGIREANTVRSLALACDVLDDAIETSNTAFEENTALTAEAEKRYGTTESKIIQMKNAFKNLKITLGDELTPELGEFLDFAKNGFASLTTAMKEGGISGLVTEFGNVLSEGLNMIIAKTPEFVEAGIQLLSALGQGLTQNIDAIMDAVINVIGQLGTAFTKNFPAVIDLGLTILEKLLSAFDENFDKIAESMKKLIAGIGEAVDKHKKSLAETAMSIIKHLYEGLIENLPEIMKFVKEMILNFVKWVGENAGDIISAAVEIITTLATGLVDALPELLPAIVDTILAIVEGLIDNVDKLIDAAIEIIIALADGLIESLPKLIEKAPEIIEKLVDAIIKAVPKLLDASVEIITKLAEYIIENLPTMVKAGNDILTAIGEGIVNMLLSVPQWGENIMNKIKEGIDKMDVPQWGKDLVKGFVEGMTGGEAFRWLREGATKVANKIKEYLGFSEPEEGPLSNFHTFAPDMMELYTKGIRDNIDIVEDAVADTASAIESGFEITAAPTYSVGVSESNIDGRLDSILEMLEAYMPTFATAQDMENMSVNVDGRQFGRLVREVG